MGQSWELAAAAFVAVKTLTGPKNAATSAIAPRLRASRPLSVTRPSPIARRRLAPRELE
jgi:hypothetical protein